MGWRIFDCFAAAALFGVLCAVLYVVITGLKRGHIMLNLYDNTLIFIVACVASLFVVAGIILVIRIFMRLRGW